MNDINELSKKVERHKAMLDDHLDQYQKDREETREILDCLRESQKTSTEALAVMTGFVQKANPMLDAWLAANGTIKTLGAIGRVMKWIASFAVVGAIIKAFSDHAH